MSLSALFLLCKLAAAVLPPLLFWMWVRRTLRADPDPRPFLNLFMVGAVGVALVGMAGNFVLARLGEPADPVSRALQEGWLYAALPEEATRAIALAVWLSRKRGFAHPKAIIGAALALGMGAIAMENLIRFHQITDDVDGYQILIQRPLICVLLIGGTSLAIAVPTAWRQACVGDWRLGLAAGLGLAVLAHGIYDSAVLMSDHVLPEQYLQFASIVIALTALAISFLPVRSRFNALINQP